MSAKHTPGPWSNDTRETNLKFTVNAGGKHLAMVSCHHISDAEGMANADLIAAAPDLLKEHTAACDAADHILALMTMEFGRLMVEGPDEEIELTLGGCTVRIAAQKFNNLYNATTRKSIAKATGEA